MTGPGTKEAAGRPDPADEDERELPPTCVPEPGGGCSICGDEGREAEVLELPRRGGRARARMLDTGERARVALDLVAGVEPGDRVLVHLGFALARVREEPERGRAS